MDGAHRFDLNAVLESRAENGLCGSLGSQHHLTPRVPFIAIYWREGIPVGLCTHPWSPLSPNSMDVLKECGIIAGSHS